MTTEEYITMLIENKQENEYVDFKRCYYDDDKKYDIIKDVVAFSNEPSSIDKYVVFGVANRTFDVIGIDESILPDVSTINDLVHTYVEPFANIELGKITIEGKSLGYIKIPSDRADRPYVIKKDYIKQGKTFLRCGEVYIRKNANNFIADRHDLDQIYRNNGVLKVEIFEPKMAIGQVVFRRHTECLGQIRVVISNNTNHAINLYKITGDLCSYESVIQYECVYFEDKSRSFATNPEKINDIPVHLNSGDALQKSLYFQISEESADILLRKKRSGTTWLLAFELFDVDGCTYKTQPTQIELCFYGNSGIL